MRKTLENRRFDYDSKYTKVQNAKKESPELEEDLRVAKFRYEEAFQDTEAKMQLVMEGDEILAGDLTALAQSQLDWFKKGIQVLEKVKDELGQVLVVFWLIFLAPIHITLREQQQGGPSKKVKMKTKARWCLIAHALLLYLRI
jgi:hypothetical protein